MQGYICTLQHHRPVTSWNLRRRNPQSQQPSK